MVILFFKGKYLKFQLVFLEFLVVANVLHVLKCKIQLLDCMFVM